MAVRRAPRAKIRDGVRLLQSLGGRSGGLPPASVFPDGVDLVRWSAMGRTYLVSRSPEHVERVFVGGYEEFQKATHYRLIAAVTGEGLLTAEGPAWERQRRLVQPVLGRRQVDGLVPSMVEATRAYLDRFEPPSPPAEVLLGEEMTEVTLDVVGRALFGSGLSAHIDRLRPAVSRGMAIALVAAQLQMIVGVGRRTIDGAGRFVRRSRLPGVVGRVREVMATFDEVVLELIDERERAGLGRHHDLLDLLLTVTDDDGRPMDRGLVRDELVTMMLAGHETTANALSWLWWWLSQEPAVDPGVPPGGHAPAPAGLGARAGGAVRPRPRRGGRASQGHRHLPGAPHPPRRPLVGGPRGVPAGALPPGRTPPGERDLPALRRGTSHLRRRQLRTDRGHPDRRHDQPAVAVRTPTGRAARRERHGDPPPS